MREKREMNEVRKNFAKRSGLQFTLREMHRDFTHWRTYGLLAIVILVAAWSGPFGTEREFPFFLRLVYWTAVVLLTFSAAHFFGAWTSFLLRRRGLHAFPRILLVTLAAGLASTAAVLPVTIVVSGKEALSPAALFSTAYHALLIAAAAVGAMELLRGKKGDAVATGPSGEAERPPPLLARLPLEKRGRLISLSVSDHYVDVVTTRGRSMVLIRLKDAIGETAPEPGIRIHRSHWVALAAVERVERRDGRLAIVTGAGEVLPVSRSYQADVRAAGLTPG